MSYAHLIKEVARGQRGSRALTREESGAAFAAALNGCMPEAALGAFLVALRMKGETVDELLGLADAWYAQAEVRLDLPPGPALPVVIGSYSGARRQANLLPLLALLLQRLGLRVLVHGADTVAGRTPSVDIFRALDAPVASARDELSAVLDEAGVVFVPLRVLAPQLAHFLAWREQIGVRHLGHSFVKTINPFTARALCLTAYTHPPYRELLRHFLLGRGQDALLLRGAEGEALASPRRLPALDWCRHGELLGFEGVETTTAPPPCALDAPATAAFTRRALADPRLLPAPLLAQAAIVLVASGAARDREHAEGMLQQCSGTGPG